MATRADLRYLSDENGKPSDVIVPLELWQQIEALPEVADLLQRERILERLEERGSVSSQEDGAQD